MANQKRIEWIDQLRGIAFYFVILGHLSIGKKLKNWVYSFHMPLFFLITGCTLNVEKIYKTDFLSYVRRLTKRMLVPYVWMQMFSFVIRYFICITATHKEVPVPTYFKGILIANNNLTQSPSNPLYYVVLLFLAQVGLWLVIRIAKADYTKIVIILTAFATVGLMLQKQDLWWHINVVPIAMLLIFVGRLIMNSYLAHKDKIESLPVKIYIPVILLLFLVGWFFSTQNGRISIHGNYYGKDFLLSLVSAVCTSVAFALTVMKLPNSRFITFVGQNTLFYMGIHKPLLLIFESLSKKDAEPLFIIIVSIVSYIILAPAVLFVNKFMPYVNGNSLKQATPAIKVFKYVAIVISLCVPYNYFVNHFHGGFFESSLALKAVAAILFFVCCGIAYFLLNLFRNYVFIEEKKQKTT